MLFVLRCLYSVFVEYLDFPSFYSMYVVSCFYAEPPLLATYKISNKDRDKNHSEPESGYRTDGSTTYSQIEDRVSDIQRKVKSLI